VAAADAGFEEFRRGIGASVEMEGDRFGRVDACFGD
jgi:hypothetical protein